jgi:hypothetical protein
LKSATATVSENITTTRIVYDFPVAAHLCDDGVVHYVRLVRRSGQPPEGTCPQCKILFQYRKPKPSKARHVDGEGIIHF